jgi:hypothetical protein
MVHVPVDDDPGTQRSSAYGLLAPSPFQRLASGPRRSSTLGGVPVLGRSGVRPLRSLAALAVALRSSIAPALDLRVCERMLLCMHAVMHACCCACMLLSMHAAVHACCCACSCACLRGCCRTCYLCIPLCMLWCLRICRSGAQPCPASIQVGVRSLGSAALSCAPPLVLKARGDPPQPARCQPFIHSAARLNRSALCAAAGA